MTPYELSERHPRLYHVTSLGGGANILERGLYSTKDILRIFEVPEPQRTVIMTRRRNCRIPLHHPHHSSVMLNDNIPLNESKLEKCLDDDLTPAQWLEMLNSRVFFWPSCKRLVQFLKASQKQRVGVDVLVVDTLGLAHAHGKSMELVPFNSGSTIFNPARRGNKTFAPLPVTDYQVWQIQRRRRKRDKIAEIAVRGSIPDISKYVLDVIEIGARG